MDQLAVAAALRASRRLPATPSFRQRRVNKAIATVNQAALLRRAAGGARRLPANAAVNRQSRLELARSLAKANLVRSRSRSRSKARGVQAPVAPQSNLRRSNSRLNLVQGGGAQQNQPRRRLNRDFQQRNRSRSQSRNRQNPPSIASRLGVRPGAAPKANQNNGPGARKKASVLNRISQGRVSKQQRLGNRPNVPAKNNKRCGTRFPWQLVPQSNPVFPLSGVVHWRLPRTT